MCSHYEGATADQLGRAFGVDAPEQGALDLWPGYLGSFVRAVGVPEEQDGDNPRLEILRGSFGLIPGWSKDTKIARRTYNARSETAAEKRHFEMLGEKGSIASFPRRRSTSRTGALVKLFQRESHGLTTS